jgi:hypothetical protein
MNSAMMAENQALQYDNKQLNTLIKEYETTLETVMGLFRQRAVRFFSLRLIYVRCSPMETSMLRFSQVLLRWLAAYSY